MIQDKLSYQRQPKSVVSTQSQCLEETHHQADFEEIGRNAHEDMNLPEQVEIERRHPVVVRDMGKKVHQDKLTVALSSITGFLVFGSLLFGTTLDDNDRRRASSSNG